MYEENPSMPKSQGRVDRHILMYMRGMQNL